MTGPEHYREAERLLRHAAASSANFRLTDVEVMDVQNIAVATAQVHATLALAASYALLPHIGAQSGFGDFEAWYKAAGVTP